MESSGHGGVGRGAGEEEEEEERPAVVYCAVGKDGGREWKANLRWVLANSPHRRSRRFSLVLAHVHRPPHRINMMGAWVPVSQLAEHEVAAYSKLEEDKASRALDDLLHICTSQRVQARKVIVSADDAATGLVRLVDDHAVAELVMGAASDRAYTRKMCAPRSKMAVTVQRKANPSCRIWFLCKGNLICTREVDEGALNRAEPSTGSSSSSPRSSAVSDCSRSKPSTPFGMHESAGPTALRRVASSRHAYSDNATDHNGAEDDHDASSSSAAPAADVVVAFFSAAPALTGLRDAEDQDSPAPSHHGSSDGAGEMDDDALYERLKEALAEARNLRHEAYEETRRRQKADRDLAHASRMAKEAESSWQGEARRRKETEEKLARERAAMEQDRRDLDGILEKIMEVDGRSAELELQIADSERAMSQLDVRLSESYGVLDALRRERQEEEEPATSSSEPSSMAPAAEESGSDQGGASFWRVRLSELEEATGNFNELSRIGGRVYRGTLRSGMSVAVRMVSPESAIDEPRFARAAEAMSRARHPGLVAFLGACPEARAVVHELVPGGSLEDRLEGKAAPPLPWQARCGVAYGTCSALAYLHSTGAAHGDVRPAKILLEEDDDGRCSSSKLVGFGTRGLFVAKEPPRRHPPCGVDLAYVDPRRLATGEPTPRGDAHALGVVLLRLVTGKPAFAARKAAREAAAGSAPWHEAVDSSAGGWPVERAMEVALLGLRCCGDEDVAGGRPAEKLLEEARGVLEAAAMAAPGRTWSALSASGSEGGGAPSYFLCPILKEVMRDPRIAGDGFTYEAEAMREWLGSGHDTSPMTNLKLATDELLPNHALRAAIQEWRHATTPRTSSTTSFDRFH